MFSEILVPYFALTVIPFCILFFANSEKPKLARICASVLVSETLLFTYAVLYPTITQVLNIDFDIRLSGYSFLLGTAFIVLLICLLTMLRMWKPSKEARRKAFLSLVSGIGITLAFVICATLYHNSHIAVKNYIYLEDYVPFGLRKRNSELTVQSGLKTLAKSLDEPSTLSFQNRHLAPSLDGAIQYYPLISAFARATYPPGYYGLNYYDDTQLRGSGAKYALDWFFEEHDPEYTANILFLREQDIPTDQEIENGDGVELVPIAKDALVFFVNSKNPVTNLSQDDIRAIYSGQIKNWQSLGGKRQKIKVYQPGGEPEEWFKSFMGNSPSIEPIGTFNLHFSLSLSFDVSEYENYKNAIGYSSRFFVEKLKDKPNFNGLRMLSIDGIAPTPENIASGLYPLADEIYAATISNRISRDENEKTRYENADTLLEWILSEQGQELVEKTGYVRIR
jgi:phosphate transport system substrate-binding protein